VIRRISGMIMGRRDARLKGGRYNAWSRRLAADLFSVFCIDAQPAPTI